MSEKMTGKQALLEMLKAEGVQHIFGNPGTSEAPIMDMLGDYPELKYFLTLQESVAMGMGESYARATEKPSLVMLHVEPEVLQTKPVEFGDTPFRGGPCGLRRYVQPHRSAHLHAHRDGARHNLALKEHLGVEEFFVPGCRRPWV